MSLHGKNGGPTSPKNISSLYCSTQSDGNIIFSNMFKFLQIFPTFCCESSVVEDVAYRLLWATHVYPIFLDYALPTDVMGNIIHCSMNPERSDLVEGSEQT